MHRATDRIEVQATPEQTWQVLSNLSRLPEWYTPAQRISVITEGPVREGWQFVLVVKTLSGLALDAVGAVQKFDPQNKIITWHGQAMGIAGNSQWRVMPAEEGYSIIEHTFEGKGWLMFLSQTLGRNRMTVHKRLVKLKELVELEWGSGD